MMKKMYFLLFIGTIAFGASALMQFEVMDTNKDGFVNEREFTVAKNKNMEAKLQQGKRLKNAGTSPTFEIIDTNNDGKISKMELLIIQNAQMQKRKDQRNKNKMMNNR